MHIDGHQHFWQLDRGDYDWLAPEIGPIYRDFLPRLFKVLERHPGLAVVIDHAAKPTIEDGVDKQWLSDIATAAEFPQVSCKLSGLVTEAGPGWNTDDLQPVVDHLLKHFGPDRLVWGSDWPVLDLASDYTTWWKSTQELLAALSQGDLANVLGQNAARIYL